MNVGQLQLNAQLAVGTVNTQVVVNTDVPLLNTESGALSATMSYETINQLPQVSSIGQNWSSFNILQPGQAGAPGGNQGSTGTGTSNGTMLSVNGNLPFSTVLADGAETTLPASANSDITVQEDIQEVQTSSSGFSAQYGVGGILYNQISKGGGDRFHGSAYEYFQNTALNANNYTFGSSATKPANPLPRVWRHHRRSDHPAEAFLLLQLRSHYRQRGQPGLLLHHAHGGGIEREFCRSPHHLRPRDHHGISTDGHFYLSRREYTDRLPLHHPHALPQQPDSGRSV